MFDKAPFLAVGKEVTGEAGSASRHREAVISRKLQGVVQEIVDVFPEAPVAAIDGGCANAVLVESHRTFVNGELVSGIHVPGPHARWGGESRSNSRPHSVHHNWPHW